MSGVGVVDMLIELYRTEVKTTRWYIKVICHMIDIAKVNSWLMYRHHYNLQQRTREVSASFLITEDLSIQVNQGIKQPKL